MNKILIFIMALFTFLFASANSVEAGWVNGYWKSNGTYVSGHWRSDPNALKYDNYSFDGDWSDAYNDSYFNPSKNYSSSWYTPSWITQDDYWIGKDFYDRRNNYKNTYDSFLDDDYDFYTSPYSTPYSTPYLTPYSTPYYSPYYTPYRSPSYNYDPPSYFDYDYDYYDYDPYNF